MELSSESTPKCDFDTFSFWTVITPGCMNISFVILSTFLMWFTSIKLSISESTVFCSCSTFFPHFFECFLILETVLVSLHCNLPFLLTRYLGLPLLPLRLLATHVQCGTSTHILLSLFSPFDVSPTHVRDQSYDSQ